MRTITECACRNDKKSFSGARGGLADVTGMKDFVDIGTSAAQTMNVPGAQERLVILLHSPLIVLTNLACGPELDRHASGSAPLSAPLKDHTVQEPSSVWLYAKLAILQGKYRSQQVALLAQAPSLLDSTVNASFTTYAKHGAADKSAISMCHMLIASCSSSIRGPCAASSCTLWCYVLHERGGVGYGGRQGLGLEFTA